MEKNRGSHIRRAGAPFRAAVRRPLVRMLMRVPVLCVMLVPLAATAPAAASEAGHGHGAHEHGVARLNLVMEGHAMEIELNAPADDIVGFEHAPASDADRKAVADAVTVLEAADGLFSFPPRAGCRLEQAEVASPLIDNQRAEHKHKPDAHAPTGHEREEHAEFTAHYHFHCDHPAALSHVDVGFFDRFPTAREIEAQTATAGGQGAQELTPGAARLMLRTP